MLGLYGFVVLAMYYLSRYLWKSRFKVYIMIYKGSGEKSANYNMEVQDFNSSTLRSF